MSTAYAQPVDTSQLGLADYKQVIIDASNGSARTQQKRLGPSEVGDPCRRKLAMKLLDIAGDHQSDPLPSAVGTGAHAWLADAFEAANRRLGRKRWVVEQALQCGPIRGHGDLYDADLFEVIDHKFPGASAMKKYTTQGPSQVYRIQAHLYGYGHQQAGRRVDRVAIVFLPRGGMLSTTHKWSEPYDESVALKAIDDLLGLGTAIDTWMDITGGDKAATVAAIPATPSRLCGWCPFLRNSNTVDLSLGCPGESPSNPNTTEGETA